MVQDIVALKLLQNIHISAGACHSILGLINISFEQL